MKKTRQEKIAELITNYDIETQDELIARLREHHFDVTQATVSRDIKELRLGLTNAEGEILRQETLIQGEEEAVLAWLGKPQNQQAILDQAQAMLAEHTRK